MAAIMRSLTSPVMAPLYWPTQARSDWIARRSACAIALAVSAGVCKAGRIGMVATCFGLAPAVDGAVIWAWADAPAATNINVAVSIDLMTSLGSIEERATKHICLVGDRDAMVQGTLTRPRPPRGVRTMRGRRGLAVPASGRKSWTDPPAISCCAKSAAPARL